MLMFVAGRIWLFGEHNDWSSGYRMFNANITTGYDIISGTNQGLHAECECHPSKLVVHSSINTIEMVGSLI
jgi:hypothetical protein